MYKEKSFFYKLLKTKITLQVNILFIPIQSVKFCILDQVIYTISYRYMTFFGGFLPPKTYNIIKRLQTERTKLCFFISFGFGLILTGLSVEIVGSLIAFSRSW